MTRKQSAEVRSIFTSQASQRLNAGDLVCKGDKEGAKLPCSPNCTQLKKIVQFFFKGPNYLSCLNQTIRINNSINKVIIVEIKALLALSGGTRCVVLLRTTRGCHGIFEGGPRTAELCAVPLSGLEIINKFFSELNSNSKSLESSKAYNLIYAYLVGLFEGDGFFTITKNGEYLKYELGIELSIRDVQLIYKIKDLLGVGKVGFRKRKDVEMVSLRIRNKDHLKKYIIPIFDKYPMFSNKQYDYLRFRSCLISNIIYYDDIPEYTRNTKPLNTIESIVNAHYFPA